MLAAILLAQERGDVEFLVAQVREGMTLVDDLRGKHGANVLAVVIAGELALLLGELVEVELLETVPLERGDDLRVDLVTFLDQRSDGREDDLKLFARRHVGLVLANVGRDDGEVHQATDTNHEELVQIRAEDADELETLEQGYRRIEGLLEHASVELEPGKLTILRVGVIEFLGLLESLFGLVFGDDASKFPATLHVSDTFARIDYRFFRGHDLVDCLGFLGCVFGHGLLHANSPLISLAF